MIIPGTGSADNAVATAFTAALNADFSVSSTRRQVW
jgi:hypothetical protein